MLEVGRIYLDTNIFMVAFEGDVSSGATFARLFSTGSTREQPRFVTSALTYSELLVKPYRDRDDELIDTYDGVIRTNEWLEVMAVDHQALRYAAVVRAQYPSVKLPDAIHIATAIGSECTHFLTADAGIKHDYRLVHVRHGFESRAAPLIIVRPDETTLASLIEGFSA